MGIRGSSSRNLDLSQPRASNSNTQFYTISNISNGSQKQSRKNFDKMRRESDFRDVANLGQPTS